MSASIAGVVLPRVEVLYSKKKQTQEPGGWLPFGTALPGFAAFFDELTQPSRSATFVATGTVNAISFLKTWFSADTVMGVQVSSLAI